MPSPVWPLPICLIHAPNILCSYAILLFTVLDLASITSYIHNWVLFFFGSISLFCLELFLHWFPVSYWAPANLWVHLSVSYLSAFSHCSWGSQGMNTEVVCHSLLQWTTFCQNSPQRPVHLGWPYMVCLSFIELARLWCMWLDWLVFCDCGFSLSALWCPLPAPTILLGFLLPWMWGISSQLLKKCSHWSLLWMWGTPHSCWYWPWM